MSVVIQTESLTKRFGDFTAVDAVSFEVQAGEVLGYLGPNGSGKTTTMRMLLGLLLPSEGRAQVLDYDVTSHAEAIRERVGYMSQKFALYDELTVWENLTFYAGVYGVRQRQQIEAVMERLGLEEMQNERAGKLPVGWRQRLALAAAIVHQPRLLFLDEPTSGVDPTARRDFWALIYDFVSEGVTAFVTTHYMDEAEYCTRVGIMNAGHLLALGAPDELKQDALSGMAWDITADTSISLSTSPLLPALGILEKTPGVLRAGLAGDHLRAITEGDVGEENLRKALGVLGGDGIQIRRAEPTLEDVFLALAS